MRGAGSGRCSSSGADSVCPLSMHSCSTIMLVIACKSIHTCSLVMRARAFFIIQYIVCVHFPAEVTVEDGYTRTRWYFVPNLTDRRRILDILSFFLICDFLILVPLNSIYGTGE